jgi:hypothetical protein
MDTATLISDAKARFAHNSHRNYLREKYTSKLIVAEQGGLWKVTPELISFLHTMTSNTVSDMILQDSYNNPIKINVNKLLKTCTETYNQTMVDWYNELHNTEKK